ncbi:hypothetical protein SERLA73DRAFT_66610 [Serpula lacrymans var. lacrymans S7.3]|uniref:CxC2-like cysteine cluster KDZ transposase-associated domain-containing protein n=1 Tax=Serpula lacrymans var. lacrymans (strain S7.3) TaxID=936435 RepID=F8QID3_SERL3|nr:hypothetical protein SERLA73DRAFT_66610 [Serpula lacrymans var. lacrymans S7.3]
MSCCRDAHQRLPFHRIERWKGTHFEPSWLYRASLVIHLGHTRKPCLGHDDNHSAPSDDEEAELWEDEEVIMMGVMPKRTSSTDINGNTMMLLVDKSSVHHFPIRWCSCPNAACLDIQLLSNGLYLSSQKKPQSAFTFSLLDDFLINNKECYTSAMTFYSRHGS